MTVTSRTTPKSWTVTDSVFVCVQCYVLSVYFLSLFRSPTICSHGQSNKPVILDWLTSLSFLIYYFFSLEGTKFHQSALSLTPCTPLPCSLLFLFVKNNGGTWALVFLHIVALLRNVKHEAFCYFFSPVLEGVPVHTRHSF